MATAAGCVLQTQRDGDAQVAAVGEVDVDRLEVDEATDLLRLRDDLFFDHTVVGRRRRGAHLAAEEEAHADEQHADTDGAEQAL